jgi:hypothetical protein
MRKVKVMMTAIGVMAVVGGALGFRARTYFAEFCTRRLADGAGICQGGYVGRMTVLVAGFYYTRATNNTTLCSLAVTNCNVSTGLTFIEL